jgi:hypothetical protein
VRRRGDRDRRCRRVDADRAAGREHGREAAPERRRVEVGRVEEHVVLAQRGEPPVDRRGHHVPRREVALRVHARHHPRAGRVHQYRALAAHRLGDQRAAAARARAGVEHGRVELHELEVGHRRTGPQRDRHPVRRGHRGVRGGLVELAQPAGRQQHRGRGQHPRHAFAVEHEQAGDVTGRRAQRVHGDVVGQHRHLAVPRGGQQRALDLGAGRVAARVHHPERGVPALAGPRRPRTVHIKHRAAGAQPVDRRRAVRDDRRRGGGVAQPTAGGERVGDVPVHRVTRDIAQHHGDAALRPAGVAPVGRVLGHHQHPQAELGRTQRRGQPGDPGADDHQVHPRLPTARPVELSTTDTAIHMWILRAPPVTLPR